MCKLSYEKCVCFIFIVIVAFLSCSGFRIDKLAMTDISKRNSFTSLNLEPRSNQFLSRLFTSNNSDYMRYDRTIYDIVPDKTTTQNKRLSKRHIQRNHRIRHARHQKHIQESQVPHFESHRQPLPEGWIDAFIFPPSGYVDSETHRTVTSLSTLRPSISEQFAQIPASGITFPYPTIPIVNRLQRSAKHRKSPRNKASRKNVSSKKNKAPKKGKVNCQAVDVASKAYRANTVVLAKVDSQTISSQRKKGDYAVTFRIEKMYKAKGNDEVVRLNFTSKKSSECEYDIRKNDLVNIKIKQNERYFLFLESDGEHNYSVLFKPVLVKERNMKKVENIIEKVCNGRFVPKSQSPILSHMPHNKKDKRKDNIVLKLGCKAGGYPLPRITWKLNHTTLRNDQRVRITYKGTNSTLRINNPQGSNEGRYYCVTTDVKGEEKISNFINFPDPPSEIPDVQPCNETYIKTYCENGGSCMMHETIGEMSCLCMAGFTGSRCDKKTSSPDINHEDGT